MKASAGAHVILRDVFGLDVVFLTRGLTLFLHLLYRLTIQYLKLHIIDPMLLQVRDNSWASTAELQSCVR